MNVSSFLYQGTQILDDRLVALGQAGALLRPVIVGAGSREAVETAVLASDAGIAEAILVGKPEEYHDIAAQLSIAPERFAFVTALDEATMIAQACGMVNRGEADCLVKGQIHTDVYMRGVFNKQDGVRDSAGGRIVHVFVLFPPTGGKPILLSDGAVNPIPDMRTKQQSVVSCIALAHALGISEPKVSVLSATESVIPSVPSSEQAAELVAWAETQDFQAKFAGPLALDGAIAPEAAAIKGLMHNGVAGESDILIVPDLVSGNVLFKSFVWLGGALAAGVVLGAKVPIILTSRADPPKARLASMILAKLMTQNT